MNKHGTPKTGQKDCIKQRQQDIYFIINKDNIGLVSLFWDVIEYRMLGWYDHQLRIQMTLYQQNPPANQHESQTG